MDNEKIDNGTEVYNFNEIVEAKIEKISLAELRAENKKIQDEDNKKVLDKFNDKLGKFLDDYMALSDEQKEQFWKSRKK